MITVIHGEDTQLSRNFYFNLKQKIASAVTLDGVTVSPLDLQQALSGQDLFGDSKTIFIEDLFSKRKGTKDIEPFIDTLNNSSENIILWESKELTARSLSPLKNASVRLFKIPSTIFAFLDNFRPSNGRQLVELFHKTLQDKDPEFVLFMTTRLIRTLLALQDNSESTISEIARLAPWQRGKLDKQSRAFSQEELLSLHSKLFQLELDMKTGASALPLADSIDLLLLSL